MNKRILYKTEVLSGSNFGSYEDNLKKRIEKMACKGWRLHKIFQRYYYPHTIVVWCKESEELAHNVHKRTIILVISLIALFGFEFASYFALQRETEFGVIKQFVQVSVMGGLAFLKISIIYKYIQYAKKSKRADLVYLYGGCALGIVGIVTSLFYEDVFKILVRDIELQSILGEYTIEFIGKVMTKSLEMVTYAVTANAIFRSLEEIVVQGKEG